MFFIPFLVCCILWELNDTRLLLFFWTQKQNPHGRDYPMIRAFGDESCYPKSQSYFLPAWTLGYCLLWAMEGPRLLRGSLFLHELCRGGVCKSMRQCPVVPGVWQALGKNVLGQQWAGERMYWGGSVLSLPLFLGRIISPGCIPFGVHSSRASSLPGVFWSKTWWDKVWITKSCHDPIITVGSLLLLLVILLCNCGSFGPCAAVAA